MLAGLGAKPHDASAASPRTLTARVEGAGFTAESCIAASCTTATFALAPEVTAPRIDSLRLRGGRPALVVEAPAREGAGRFVVIVTADDDGAPRELLRGWLGRPRGVAGARQSRTLLREASRGEETLSFGTHHEALSACGRDTLTRVKELDPVTLAWTTATNRILTAQARATATRLFARRAGTLDTTLPALLAATAASSANDDGYAGLTDGSLARGWEARADGADSSEFVVTMGSPLVPIEGFQLAPRRVPSDPDAEAESGAPRTLWLLTETDTFHVTLPEDARNQPPGTAYEIALPSAIRAGCVTVVVEERYGAEGAPLGLAELRATTHLDRAGGFPGLVAQLDRRGEDAQGAALALARSGDKAHSAIVAGFDALGPGGRSRALAILDLGTCAQVTKFYAERLVGRGRPASWSPDGDESRDVHRERVRHCTAEGRLALSQLVREGQDDRERGLAARELAALAPDLAVTAIAEALDGASTALRVRLRDAMTATTRDLRARAALDALLAPASFATRPRGVQLELLRSLGSSLATFPAARGAFAALTKTEGDFASRFLLLGPAGHLARGGDPDATTHLLAALARDPDARIRTEASRHARGVAAASASLTAALADPSPRVREAALEALGSLQGGTHASTTATLLASDPWTFVRVAAAGALGAISGAPPALRGLLAALDDRSALVRLAAIRAIASGIALRGIGGELAVEAADRVHSIADDPRLATELRAAAITAVGKLCRADSTELLYKLALRTGAPELGYDRELGMAALGALAWLRPADRAARLAPLLADSRTPADVRSIVRTVIERAGRCER
ncbi:MAG: HEAT repeat domain-containing protein [Deltaproteobacteria bacterium]|nr:HEAT repeat domain-containing protein [Deltaproteobacteria bacterium]